jgi:photosystem II stability/assembly factor-like uncharacterized protein
MRAAALIGLATLTTGAQSPPTPPRVAALDAWTLIYDRRSSGPARYEDLAFPDEKHGWLVSARGDILHTADGGRTWVSQASELRGLRSIDFLDARRGFAGTLTGTFYATTDGGATWNDITTSLPKAAKGFCGITHVGDAVHVVGRYTGAADYFFSPDAGKTWRHTDLGEIAQGLVDVSFVSRDVGFITGMAKSQSPDQGTAVILKTTDGGKRWRIVYEHDGGRGLVWKLFPVSHQLIYASLQSYDGVYRVAKSTDGGDTWNTIVLASGRQPWPQVQAIGFVDEKTGFVAGFFEGMWGTRDGGETWTRIAVPHGLINRFERVGNTLITAGSGGVLRFDGMASPGR